jgi:hypothetical protein
VSRFGLSEEEVAAVAVLRTVKREYATAFLCNGKRGSGTVSIRVSEAEYWIATSDPVRDEPLRRRALHEAGGDPWEALRLLACAEWHARVAERGG